MFTRVRIFELTAPASPQHGPRLLELLPAPWQAGEVVSLPAPDDNRVEASLLLDSLPLPPAGWVHLGLCAVDLFVPALTYVFGASRLQEGRGLLSWNRLRPRNGAGRLERRLLTEALHELGHAAGLTHCSIHACSMHRALWPESIDLKQPSYCPSCEETLTLLLRERPADSGDSRWAP